ncbi:MAG: TonB-dependent receptor [Candidatus Rokubacteria bacterium]|nr:TonB-dependent receptor [Candidatus Rokubacteria bacterium]
MTLIRWSVTAAVLMATVTAWAQEVKRLEPVVVTATKVETPQERLGASVTVITEEELRAYNYTRIEDVLRRSGSLGKTTTLSIRGANSSQVQVLVDGMRVKSPTLGSLDFAELSLDAIERIEIVRGPQSTLHGSDAMGGVVNIITKKGQGPVHGSVFVGGGSYETFRQQAEIAGAQRGFNVSLSGSRYDSGGQFNNDDSEQTAFAGRIGYDFPWKGELALAGRYAKLSTDLPINSVNPVIFDPNSQQQTETWLYNLTYTQKVFPWWDTSLRYGQWWNNQGFQDPPPPGGAVGDDTAENAFANPASQINTRRREFELINAFHLGTWNTFTVGWQHLNERGINRSVCSPLLGVFAITHDCDTGSFLFRQEVNTMSVFGQDEVRLFDRIFLVGGLRWDDNDQFGDEVTPRMSAAIVIKETGSRLRGGWGKGFRAPTINDLVFPGFGRPGVGPERSESYEFGFDQKLWQNRIRFGGTAFHNEFRNLITFVCDPTGTMCGAGNQGGARSQGIESYAELDPFDWMHLYANYTFTRTHNNSGRELQGFARHRWNTGVTLTPIERLALFAQAHIESSLLAFAGRKPGYHRIDVGGAYRLLGRTGVMEKLEFTARVENLTDEVYEEVQGFRALGWSALVGLRAYFR